VILQRQQKLFVAVGLLQTHPGRAATREESRVLDGKMRQESIARAGDVVGCFQQPQLPEGPTRPSGPHPAVDVRWSKLEVSAVGPKNAKGMENDSEAAQGHCPGQALAQAAQGSGGVTISGGVQRTCRCGTLGHGLAGMGVLG